MTNPKTVIRVKNVRNQDLLTLDETGKLWAVNFDGVGGGGVEFLYELTDVDINPNDISHGEVLKYDDTTQKWVSYPRFYSTWIDPMIVIPDTIEADLSTYTTLFNFESGTLPAGWVADIAPSVIDRPDAERGTTKALQFADINDSQSTTITFTLDWTLGTRILTFRYATDSEGNYDFLKLRLNGVEFLNVAGQNLDWASTQIQIENGPNVITMLYAKDGSQSDGQDTAWIGEIGSYVGVITPAKQTQYFKGDLVRATIPGETTPTLYMCLIDYASINPTHVNGPEYWLKILSSNVKDTEVASQVPVLDPYTNNLGSATWTTVANQLTVLQTNSKLRVDQENLQDRIDIVGAIKILDPTMVLKSDYVGFPREMMLSKNFQHSLEQYSTTFKWAMTPWASRTKIPLTYNASKLLAKATFQSDSVAPLTLWTVGTPQTPEGATLIVFECTIKIPANAVPGVVTIKKFIGNGVTDYSTYTGTTTDHYTIATITGNTTTTTTVTYKFLDVRDNSTANYYTYSSTKNIPGFAVTVTGGSVATKCNVELSNVSIISIGSTKGNVVNPADWLYSSAMLLYGSTYTPTNNGVITGVIVDTTNSTNWNRFISQELIVEIIPFINTTPRPANYLKPVGYIAYTPDLPTSLINNTLPITDKLHPLQLPRANLYDRLVALSRKLTADYTDAEIIKAKGYSDVMNIKAIAGAEHVFDHPTPPIIDLLPNKALTSFGGAYIEALIGSPMYWVDNTPYPAENKLAYDAILPNQYVSTYYAPGKEPIATIVDGLITATSGEGIDAFFGNPDPWRPDTFYFHHIAAGLATASTTRGQRYQITFSCKYVGEYVDYIQVYKAGSGTYPSRTYVTPSYLLENPMPTDGYLMTQNQDEWAMYSFVMESDDVPAVDMKINIRSRPEGSPQQSIQLKDFSIIEALDISVDGADLQSSPPAVAKTEASFIEYLTYPIWIKMNEDGSVDNYYRFDITSGTWLETNPTIIFQECVGIMLQPIELDLSDIEAALDLFILNFATEPEV